MAVTLDDLKGNKRLADRTFRGATLLGGTAIAVILGLISWTIASKSSLAFRTEGLSFFTERRWAPADDVFGALSFIYGTAVTALIAVVLAVPVSLGIALFTTHVAPGWLKRPLVAMTDLVAVVPSVVFGLWGIIFLAPKLVPVFTKLSSWSDGIPILGSIFGKASAGRTFMTAGLILALMIIPIITSISREVILTCPPTDSDGALALGATRWEMITGAVLTHSAGGIVGAVMLGSSPAITANLFSSGDSLPSVIAFEWGEATSDTKRSALIAMGLTLFLMTLLVNFVATFVVNRAMKRMRGES
jgi:phosphate transport system permease protein